MFGDISCGKFLILCRTFLSVTPALLWQSMFNISRAILLLPGLFIDFVQLNHAVEAFLLAVVFVLPCTCFLVLY